MMNALMRRLAKRAVTTMLLAVALASCSDTGRSPTSPSPTTPKGTVSIKGLPPEGLNVGYSIELSADLTRPDGIRITGQARWRSTNPRIARFTSPAVLEGVAPGDTTITAELQGVTGQARARILTPMVDDAYWREIAFDEYDCTEGRRAGCAQLENRRLWRLPTTSPNFLIVEGSLRSIERIRRVIPNAVEQITGHAYTGEIRVGSDVNADNWITIEGITSSTTPTATACQGLWVDDETAVGRAYVGRIRGCIVLNTGLTREPDDKTVRHEMGHAMGFFHTRNLQDVMFPGGNHRPARFSGLEQHHTQFAYTQARYSTYAEITLSGARPIRKPGSRSPWAHGGIVTD